MNNKAIKVWIQKGYMGSEPTIRMTTMENKTYIIENALEILLIMLNSYGFVPNLEPGQKILRATMKL